jgi:hypothetical protein
MNYITWEEKLDEGNQTSQHKGYEIRNKRIRERSSDKADIQTMKNGQCINKRKGLRR